MAVPVSVEADHDSPASVEGSGDINHVVDELTDFMTAPNPGLRAVAVKNMFSLTGSRDYLTVFRGNSKPVEAFVTVIRGEIIPNIKKDAYNALINLSSDAIVAEALVDNYQNSLLPELVTEILDPKSEYADLACIVLANLTRNTEHAIMRVLKLRQQALNPSFEAKGEHEHDEEVEGEVIYALLKAFLNEKYNQNKQSLHWLGSVFANVTQNPLGRKVVLNRKHFAFQRLLSFLTHAEVIRRGGVVAMIRNCSFDETIHPWLLGNEVDILPHILLPLAGPEELSEEDMEGMPDELQYLPDDKQREPDAKLRLMLVETLLQLCSTKLGRETCRAKKVYPIVRELHSVEKTEDLEKHIYDLVNILMSDEDPNVDNVKKVVIPPNVKENPDYAPAAATTESARTELDKSLYHEQVTITPKNKSAV